MAPRTFSKVTKDCPTPGAVHVPSATGKPDKKPVPVAAGADTKKFQQFVKADVVNKKLGLVFGWAMVSKKDGKRYIDVQNDEIPDMPMLEAITDFMENSRVAKEMHAGEQESSYLFCFPMTEDIAKAMKITTEKYGVMIGYKPTAAVFAKFESGEYTGFSIGGEIIDSEEVESD